MEPGSGEELAEALGQAAAARQRIRLSGNDTKRCMGGPVEAGDVEVSTRRLNRVLHYEPKDLTISVEAGMRWGDLTRMLAGQGQMIPLDPSFPEDATVGGVIAANQSGPRRRLFGTARDMVIGMRFATLEGKLVETGGLVVKNVAGLDMGKLLIGSFGTLAAIVSVNFRLHPIPAATRTFARDFAEVGGAMEARDRVLKSVLQPAALDLIRFDGRYQVLVMAGGSESMLARYDHELAGFDGVDAGVWKPIYPPPEGGAVVRISCRLTEVGRVMESLPGRAVARAGNGVVYGIFERASEGIGRGVIEWAPDEFRAERRQELWPSPGDDFPIMERIKIMFDPDLLLNRGRLYGRI